MRLNMPEISREILNEFGLHVQQIEQSAGTIHELAEVGIYTDKEARFIKREVERLLYVPKLPNAGAHERNMVERFRRLARKHEWGARYRAADAAEKWSQVDGWYYKRRPLQSNRDADEYAFYTSMRSIAAEHGQWEIHWFATEMLNGLPQPVANFRMECKYLLEKWDGTMDRLVMLRNSIGEKTELKPLPSEPFSSPRKLQEWLNNQGGYVWNGGQDEMSALMVDVAHESAHRRVKQIVSCGWHPLGGRLDNETIEFSPLRGLYFFDDCAWGPNGELLRTDELGIYWYDGQGYQLGENGRESEFLQNKPKLHPDMAVSALPLDISDSHTAEIDALREFFQKVTQRFNRALGGLEGQLMLGAIFAFAAAAEIYAHFTQFPGLWVHGEAGSGKTTSVDWLMRFWGFQLGKGLSLISKSTTVVGVLMLGEQFSNLPGWLDEYRNTDEGDMPAKVSVVRSSFMRDSQAKWTPDGKQRTLRTAFIVSGESTSDDAATRGRFPHVQVAKSKRTGTPEEQTENLDWLQRHAPYFFVFGRFLLQHRPAFAKHCMRLVDQWRHSDETIGISEREKLVHGVSYASFAAMAELLQSHRPAELEEFRRFMVAHGQKASDDVHSELNVNIWWDELITCVKVNAVDVNHFRVEAVESLPFPPDRPNQGPWTKYVLFLDPDPIVAEMAIYRNKQHRKASLQRKDLRDQLSKNAYWVQGAHSKRVGSAKTRAHCWGIDLDLHPQGYKCISDDEYQRYLADQSEGDPRKGPLFSIIQKLSNSDSEPKPGWR